MGLAGQGFHGCAGVVSNLAMKSFAAVAFALGLAGGAVAATPLDPASAARNAPEAPFRVSDDIAFVGTHDLGIWLISTRAGLILIDGGYEPTPPQILASIRKLGFDPKQVKILLNSQAHSDHAGGFAELKRITGAKLLVSRADAALIERGGHGDPNFGDSLTFPPAHVDGFVTDGGKITLGGLTLTAHLTPGHTPGCTTWTMPTRLEGRTVQALFLCGLTAPGYRLVGNRAYPNIAADYEASFARVRSLKCELFLGAHGSYFGIEAKRAAMRKTGSAKAFVDAKGCRAAVDGAEQAFRETLAEQRKGSKP